MPRATRERVQNGAQDEVVHVDGQVVIAAALVGAQRREVVGRADCDDGLARVDARLQLAGAQLAQQRGRSRVRLKRAEHERVDRVGSEFGRRLRGAVGGLDGVAVCVISDRTTTDDR
jgi:hypothetical protein